MLPVVTVPVTYMSMICVNLVDNIQNKMLDI
jgi:hypothetical protein